MDFSLLDNSVHGILQARILEWVAIPFFRGSSQLRDWTQVSCTAGKFFMTEPPGKLNLWTQVLLLLLFLHFIVEVTKTKRPTIQKALEAELKNPSSLAPRLMFRSSMLPLWMSHLGIFIHQGEHICLNFQYPEILIYRVVFLTLNIYSKLVSIHRHIKMSIKTSQKEISLKNVSVIYTKEKHSVETVFV